MDGTAAGSGPGPRTLIPHQKDVILASNDMVAIDAVAAKKMGFDPMSIRYINQGTQRRLGQGNPREIEIVGMPEVAEENWGLILSRSFLVSGKGQAGRRRMERNQPLGSAL